MWTYIYLKCIYWVSTPRRALQATKVSEMRNGLLCPEVFPLEKQLLEETSALGQAHLRLHLPGKSLPSHGAKSHLLLQPPAPPAPQAVPLSLSSFPTFSLAPPRAWEGKNCLHPVCPQSPAQRYSRNLLTWIKSVRQPAVSSEDPKEF